MSVLCHKQSKKKNGVKKCPSLPRQPSLNVFIGKGRGSTSERGTMGRHSVLMGGGGGAPVMKEDTQY
jgi:hypothetical protein